MEVGVHEAKTNLSALLRRAAAGEDVVITRSGAPVARLVPIRASRPRQLGLDAGKVVIADDFDAPLPPDLQAYFE